MATHRFFLPIVAAVLGLAFSACQSTPDHHHHTATPHHGKRIPSDCTVAGESRR